MRVITTLALALLALSALSQAARSAEAVSLPDQYQSSIRPLLQEFCVGCHSAQKHKGSLNLEQFESLSQVRRDLHPWTMMAELVTAGEMPPEGKKQPSDEQRRQLLDWLDRFLSAEAMARAGDPGAVPLRRLSNAEYDYTIRDLTGVDLHPTREFPADGAGGEGFTNAAESLSDMSPTLLGKYLRAAKAVSDHAVFLPDGFCFSPSTTRRDWTSEWVDRIRAFYAGYADPEGKLPLKPYMAALLQNRAALREGRTRIEAIADSQRLNAKYLKTLWRMLSEPDDQSPLDQVRRQFAIATADDRGVESILTLIGNWQSSLWSARRVGSYVNPLRQAASDPTFATSQPVRVAYKLQPGRETASLFLSSLPCTSARSGWVVWKNCRFEQTRQPPLSLRACLSASLDLRLANRELLDRADRRSVTATLHSRQPVEIGPDDILAPVGQTLQIYLPAALVGRRQFVADAQPIGVDDQTFFQVAASTSAAPPAMFWDGVGVALGPASQESRDRFRAKLWAFRELFPRFVCFPHVIPTDEAVCLKQFHREDEPLVRLMLDASQKAQIDRLWEEQRFVSQFPLSENKYLPLFIGFVTQDQPKETLRFFEGFREPFARRAADFEQELAAATPRQMEHLLAFAERAFRRPLLQAERQAFQEQFAEMKARGSSDEEAIRGVIARVLTSPAFLFKIESAPPGLKAAAVNDYELATRLSYFLWSTLPDQELLSLAAQGRLHDRQALQEQAARMLQDERVEALAVEFGTQWIHVRGFADFNEKNEKLFPDFAPSLRADIDRESVLFFKALFQNDGRVSDLLDGDFTFLNESLAKFYGIPGVSGASWRKVAGVKQFGRGGILTLASVLAKEAGASRTSPVLRGNWVVETLLGEKLPRPPPDVPRLPEEEGSAGLTTRQMVEKHTQSAACAVCHRRIDPIGFTFEAYDAVGRLRQRETSGLPIDCRSTLKDGSALDGIDGLRQYLLTRKKDVVTRLLCRRLLGYALGRAVSLSDTATLDEMVSELNKHDGHLSAAVMAIVRSQQFRFIRGRDWTDEVQ